MPSARAKSYEIRRRKQFSGWKNNMFKRTLRELEEELRACRFQKSMFENEVKEPEKTWLESIAVKLKTESWQR